MRIPLTSFALAVALASPALSLECGGGYVIFETRVSLPASMGRLVRLNQYAWGPEGALHVCDLTLDGVQAGGTYNWHIFSEEIQTGDRARGIPFYEGVCFEAVTARNGTWYSCQNASVVFAGRAHFPGGSYTTRMPFDDWRRSMNDFSQR